MRRMLLVAAALMACTTLFAGAALAKTFVCKAVPCLGTAQDDQITERKGSVRDVIRAGGGDDQVDASLAVKDRDGVHGDGGDDFLNVADGDFRDSAIGGPGFDTCAVDTDFSTDSGNVDGLSSCENPITPARSAGAAARSGSEGAEGFRPLTAEELKAAEANYDR